MTSRFSPSTSTTLQKVRWFPRLKSSPTREFPLAALLVMGEPELAHALNRPLELFGTLEVGVLGQHPLLGSQTDFFKFTIRQLAQAGDDFRRVTGSRISHPGVKKLSSPGHGSETMAAAQAAASKRRTEGE